MSGSKGHRRRAVVLVRPARDDTRWITLCASYCRGRGLLVAFVARRLEDALAMLSTGQADVLVCMAMEDVWPTIQFVTSGFAEAVDDPSRRRPQRTGRVPRDDDRRPGWSTELR